MHDGALFRTTVSLPLPDELDSTQETISEMLTLLKSVEETLFDFNRTRITPHIVKLPEKSDVTLLVHIFLFLTYQDWYLGKYEYIY